MLLLLLLLVVGCWLFVWLIDWLIDCLFVCLFVCLLFVVCWLLLLLAWGFNHDGLTWIDVSCGWICWIMTFYVMLSSGPPCHRHSRLKVVGFFGIPNHPKTYWTQVFDIHFAMANKFRIDNDVVLIGMSYSPVLLLTVALWSVAGLWSFIEQNESVLAHRQQSSPKSLHSIFHNILIYFVFAHSASVFFRSRFC